MQYKRPDPPGRGELRWPGRNGSRRSASESSSFPSYRQDGTLLSALRPPGEVLGLRFDDGATLRWNVEPSAGVYEICRDDLAALPGAGYGACFRSGLSTITATDTDAPVPASGFLYLVTVRNRLREEGTKGGTSDGNARGGTVCP